MSIINRKLALVSQNFNLIFKNTCLPVQNYYTTLAPSLLGRVSQKNFKELLESKVRSGQSSFKVQKFKYVQKSNPNMHNFILVVRDHREIRIF